MPILNYATREEWLALRSTRIGASEVSALFGAQADYQPSKYALWYIKSGRILPPEVSGERVEAGLRFEEAIAAWVAEINGWKVRRFPGYVTHPTIAGLGCSPDFEILDNERGPGLLETKSIDWLAHKKSWTDGEPALPVLLQLQTQLACTGYTWGAVGAVIGGNQPVTHIYEAHPKLIVDIEARVTAFWQSIADNKPPVSDGSASAAAALVALYPAAALDEIDLSADNELPELCAKLAHARAAAKVADTAASEARNRILAKVGEHARAKLEGWIIKAPAVKASTYTVNRKASRTISVEEILTS